MAQTAAKRKYDATYGSIPYTPASNVAAGEVVSLLGGVPTIAPHAIVANNLGVVDSAGIWDVPKTNATVFVQGGYVFWNASATDKAGNTGAAENAGANPMGVCTANAAAGTGYVETLLIPMSGMAREPLLTVAGAGGNIATAAALSEGVNYVTGADNTVGVQLPSCVNGKRCTVINYTTDKTLKVYPPTGKQVNLAGANNAIAQAANTKVEYVSEGANCWFGSS